MFLSKKIVILVSTLLVMAVAAGVICAIVFTRDDDNDHSDSLPMDVTRPGVKLAVSSGDTRDDQWLVILDDDADVDAVSEELEAFNANVKILHKDNDVKTMTIKCDSTELAAVMESSILNQVGRYYEKIVMFNATQGSSTSLWGLDRIDQQSLPLSGTYDPIGRGEGVDVHVLDTGVRASHSQFGGRVKAGYDAVGDGMSTLTDCQSHGTHVAGTVGGSTFGVANRVNLYSSRVLGCNGSGSNVQIINAIRWVMNQPRNRPTVISMSLGGSVSSQLDQTVADAVNSGITVVVAAGNENVDACNTSPARSPLAITVAASDRNDARASFSNFGSCIDIFGPGVAIVSASNNSDAGTNTFSGTSMATPHVAGAAAIVLSQNPSFSPFQVRDYLVKNAAPNKITDTKGSSNLLMYVGAVTTQAPTSSTSSTSSTTSSSTTMASSTSSSTSPATSSSSPASSTQTPASSAAPTTSTTVTGSLQRRQFATPSQATYTVTTSGVHTAQLRGQAGTDFDLYLFKYVNGQWQQVASSTRTGSSESITYTDRTTTSQQSYAWGIKSYAGSGTYTLTFTRPN